MSVRGYGIGEIKAEAAMTSDITLRKDISIEMLTDLMEAERRMMDVYTGMNRKYAPFGYSPVTGGPLTGGRYVFDSWENVKDYFRFTREELEFEPGVKFWDRPVFRHVDKHIWKVIGAHDFLPVDQHRINRFERWTYTADSSRVADVLSKAWPAMREEARHQGLAGVWLLHQPDEKQIAVLLLADTEQVTAQNGEGVAENALQQLAMVPSLGSHFPAIDGLKKAFDRTNMIMSSWLPLSRQQKGAPVANPMSPPLPMPEIPAQKV
ncbi:hypothetical protein [Serratia proteamaculans]|uniref:Uncharacterized protein n=1 Tax=Serratia proteamaculans TaxID=28151 RepID=A0A5Q2VBN5_SERPR|nr:hypothetical protein [Serratia proteamaculans]QGH61594.1 hypothetical protein GHV41_12475 [Serratia proteamaculans]